MAQNRPLSWLVSSWWVVLFVLGTATIFVSAMRTKRIALEELQGRLVAMEEEKRQVMRDHEELSLRIASQADPAWIELVLLKELGMVPDGFLKVHFKK